MPRWDPDAQSRLVAAAIELFGQRGYESVTITEIAERAGLTRRSFFRHFPDKREVLFAGSEQNTAAIAEIVGEFGPDVSARDAVMATLAQVGAFLLQDPEAQALRQHLINDSPELQERERTKLAAMATALATGLVGRGISPNAAQSLGVVAAEIFHSAYLRSITDSHAASFADQLETSHAAILRFLADEGTVRRTE